MKRSPPLWRDAAGVFVATTVVISYVTVGFIAVASQLVFGITVTFPESWMSAMLSISSVALGFLLKTKAEHPADDRGDPQ